jgi:hypothetical protein
VAVITLLLAGLEVSTKLSTGEDALTLVIHVFELIGALLLFPADGFVANPPAEATATFTDPACV